MVIKFLNQIKIKYLVEHGADIHADNDRDLLLAREEGHSDVVNISRIHKISQKDKIYDIFYNIIL